MSKESIAEKVRERIVQEYGVPKFLEDDVELKTIGDSLDKIQLNMSLEDEFNILIIPQICSYIYNEIPLNCYGNPERVDAWLAGKKETI